MRRNLIATTAVSLVFAVATVSAQETAVTDTTGAGTGWEGPIADALFTDETMMTARPAEEIQSNWQTLSEDERQQVMSQCEMHQGGLGEMDAAGDGAGDAMAAGDAGAEAGTVTAGDAEADATMGADAETMAAGDAGTDATTGVAGGEAVAGDAGADAAAGAAGGDAMAADTTTTATGTVGGQDTADVGATDPMAPERAGQPDEQQLAQICSVVQTL